MGPSDCASWNCSVGVLGFVSDDNYRFVGYPVAMSVPDEHVVVTMAAG